MHTHHTAWQAGATALVAAGLIALGATITSARDLDHALSLLEQAHQELKEAKQDKGGHRKRAMERVDDAVTVLREEQRYRVEQREERREREDRDGDRDRPTGQQGKNGDLQKQER